MWADIAPIRSLGGADYGMGGSPSQISTRRIRPTAYAMRPSEARCAARPDLVLVGLH